MMFVERFLEVMRRQPEAVAVEEGESRLTYRALDARARALAKSLTAHGIGREDVVGLGLRKSADYLVGLLGTWYAGAAFLPLDPALPGARLRFLAEDAGARLILTRKADADPFRDPPSPVLLWPGDSSDDDCGAGLAPDLKGDDLAYVIYTSGSTGVPKGVLIPQRGIVNLIDGQIPAFGLRPGSRALWLLSTSFDASVSDIGTALLAGATLCIEPGGALETAAELLGVVERRGITHLDLPPALLALLDPAVAPACLETLIIGGEPCPPEVVRRWAGRVRVVNVYGPTEATVCSSLGRCDPESWSRPLLGRPLPGVRYHVLNETLEAVPVGEPGELWIGGVGLARGYLGRPELNAERFREVAGERLYRTGDRVVRHADGEYEFLGRVDRQVKVRGQLVSPEEVEHCLRRHPSIAQAAVIKRRLATSEALVAFVVPAGSWGADAERAVRRHLSAHLPAWMQPQRLEPLDALPMTRIGKTDLAELETRPLSPGDSAQLVAPGSPEEAALLAVWQAVLERTDFGVTDDFFALGGDSLTVLRGVAAAEAQGVPCPPGLLLERRTVRGVVASLSASACGGSEGVSAETLRRDVERCGAALEPLSPGARPVIPVSPAGGTPRRILLTGATGFLGSRLLYELLRRTPAEIVCIVRAGSPHSGQRRCAEAVAAHGLTLEAADRERLHVLCGDLSQPYFGLAEDTWRRLSTEIDTVHHGGAWVHLVHPYETLRATNLDGTAAVLRLVGSGRSKRLHYVSTLSVFVATDRNTGVMEEDDDLARTRTIYGGYAQSKWAAEVLVRQCSPPSAAVSIYRLGLITGDTQTGYAPRLDQLGLFLRGLAELGCFPEALGSRLRVDITPVDYTTAALAQLSLLPAPSGRPSTFHLASPRGATLAQLARALRRAGVLLEAVSTAEWKARLAARSPQRSEAASTAYVSLCRGKGEAAAFARQRTLDLFQATGTRFDMKNTDAGLEGMGMACPEATPALLDLYVHRALRTGEAG